MKLLTFFAAELIVALLLVAVVFIVLIWQPIWVSIIATIVMVSGFYGIAFWSRSKQHFARILVFACPLSYTIWLIGLGLSISANTGGLWLSSLGFYAIGLVLLGMHLMINLRLR